MGRSPAGTLRDECVRACTRMRMVAGWLGGWGVGGLGRGRRRSVGLVAIKECINTRNRDADKYQGRPITPNDEQSCPSNGMLCIQTCMFAQRACNKT